MAIMKMTVSDGKGCTDIAKFPYQFYATDSDGVHSINIVMPLGGKESGLFRFPKINEVVIVDQDSDNKYYLLGYLPSESDAANNFLANLNGGNGEEEALEAEKGIILRYEQTGLKKPPAYDPKDTSELYSEIGFYHRPTQWKAGTDSKDNYNDFDTNNPDIPRIDQINIQSSGDIHAKAVNHHLTKAERIEILAGAPEVLDRKTNAVDDHGTLPLGDLPGDDSALHRGDFHIRAANRIIIKADQEIRIQVGRTVLRIDDTGFNVITRNVAGNYINTYDTMLDMNPRNGINLTGKNINLRAGYRFNAGDGLGGMVATAMGNLNLGGREISIDAYNNTEYMFNTIYQGLEYLVNAASGGMALAKDDIKIADYINFAQQSLEQLIRLARQVSELFAKRKEIQAKQVAEDIAGARRALRGGLNDDEAVVAAAQIHAQVNAGVAAWQDRVAAERARRGNQPAAGNAPAVDAHGHPMNPGRNQPAARNAPALNAHGQPVNPGGNQPAAPAGNPAPAAPPAVDAHGHPL
jgi:hypothetical protein